MVSGSGRYEGKVKYRTIAIKANLINLSFVNGMGSTQRVKGRNDVG